MLIAGTNGVQRANRPAKKTGAATDVAASLMRMWRTLIRFSALTPHSAEYVDGTPFLASNPALLYDYIGHETESSGPEKNRPPHSGTLQSVCGRVLARDTRSRRQPEHRGTIAIHSE